MKINQKISLGFILILSLTLIMGYVGLNKTIYIKNSYEKAELATKMGNILYELIDLRQKYMIEKNEKHLKEWHNVMENAYKIVEESENKFKAKDDLEMIAKYKETAKIYQNSFIEYEEAEKNISNSEIEMEETLKITKQSLLLLHDSQLAQLYNEFNQNFPMNKLRERFDKTEDAHNIMKHIFEIQEADTLYMKNKTDIYKNNINNIFQEIFEIISNTKSKMKLKENIEQLNNLKKSIENYKKAFENKALMLQNEKVILSNLTEKANEFIKISEKLVLGQKNKMKNAQSEAIKLIIIFLILALIIGVYASISILKSITKPINESINLIKDIAEGEGDLTKRMPINSNDEIGELSTYINKFIDKLEKIIMNLKIASERVASYAVELSSNLDNVANNAQKQAEELENLQNNSKEIKESVEKVSENVTSQMTSIEESSTAVTEISQTSEVMANSARNTTLLSEEASQNAEEGKKAVYNTLKGMEKIEEAVKIIEEKITYLGENTVKGIEKKALKLGESSEEIGSILEPV